MRLHGRTANFLCIDSRRASRKPSILFPAYQGFLNPLRANAQHDTSAATFYSACGYQSRGPIRLSSSQLVSCSSSSPVPLTWSHDCMKDPMSWAWLNSAPYDLLSRRLNSTRLLRPGTPANDSLSDGETSSTPCSSPMGKLQLSLHVQSLVAMIGLHR